MCTIVCSPLIMRDECCSFRLVVEFSLVYGFSHNERGGFFDEILLFLFPYINLTKVCFHVFSQDST